MSVVERAKEARRAELARKQEAEDSRRDQIVNQARIAFRGLFAESPEEAFYEEGRGGAMIRHEGLVFRGRWIDDGPGSLVRHFCLYLQGQCPRCGQPCESFLLRSLEQLGALLEEFKPASTHQCSTHGKSSDAEG